jgi:sarcosine oxidase
MPVPDRRRTYDVLVAGLGGMGSAVAARSALRGARVLGVERFERAHERGASSGKTRIIRQAYYESAAYVPLLLRAYELWADAERRTGAELLRLCGLLMCGRADSEVIDGSLRAAREHALPVEELATADVVARFPTLRPREDEIGVFERVGGAVFPERAVAAHLAIAERADAELRFGTALHTWESDGERVTVTFEDGSAAEAGALVLTLGPWIARELAAVGIPLVVQRNVQVWFAPQTRAYDATRFPTFLLDRAGLPAPLYGFPDFGDGVKAAFHSYGTTTSADALNRAIDPATDVAPLAAALEAWMPQAAGAYREGKACMYALTPDRNFVVDRHPAYGNVVLCGGFSGHGYKFASAIGEIGAELALTGSTSYELGFLSARRFARR